ncbi:hypothetical protein TIFTF001_016421 [Ficus carica]|uniref:Uncharacterized protein n=1 Tax=Ficus carica TaxID=3494 RepID=A0AA88D9V3_FICCA|nr:hypothetical protein TIFTF001_016421 [Ficus carica]
MLVSTSHARNHDTEGLKRGHHVQTLSSKPQGHCHQVVLPTPPRFDRFIQRVDQDLFGELFSIIQEPNELHHGLIKGFGMVVTKIPNCSDIVALLALKRGLLAKSNF